MNTETYTTVPARCRAIAARVEPYKPKETWTYNGVAVMAVSFALAHRDEESIQWFKYYRCWTTADDLEVCVAKAMWLYARHKCESPEDLLGKKILAWFNTCDTREQTATNLVSTMRSWTEKVSKDQTDLNRKTAIFQLVKHCGLDVEVKQEDGTMSEETRETLASVTVDFVHTMNAWANSVGIASPTNPWLLVMDSQEAPSSEEESATTQEAPSSEEPATTEKEKLKIVSTVSTNPEPFKRNSPTAAQIAADPSCYPFTPPALLTIDTIMADSGFPGIEFFLKCQPGSPVLQVLDAVKDFRLVAVGAGNLVNGMKIPVPELVKQHEPEHKCGWYWYTNKTATIWACVGHFWPAGCLTFVDAATGNTECVDLFSHTVHDVQVQLEEGWIDAAKFLATLEPATNKEPPVSEDGGGGGKGEDAPVTLQLPNALYNRVNVMAHLDTSEVQEALSKYLESVDAMLESTMVDPNTLKFVQMAREEFFGSVPDGPKLKMSAFDEPDPIRIMNAVKKDGLELRRATENIRGNRDIVLVAVQQDGYALKYASEELNDDHVVVLAAVQQNGYALQYASEELKGDHVVVLAAVQQNGYALQYASEELKGDRAIVLAAVHQNGHALQSASDELRADRDIVLVAVQQHGCALYYASEELKGDRDFVLTAVRFKDALNYASDELKGDRAIVLAAVRHNGHALQYASDELRADREIVLAAVRSNGCALQYALGGLRADRHLVTNAIMDDGRALEYASKELQAELHGF